MASSARDHVDVLIVGAGLSGIGAAAHLRRQSPGKTYAILEARDASGGTWDLFRYPGIRSDSDMFTLGYTFKPWTDDRALADGPSILEYVRETAREYDVDRHIRFGHKVTGADWSSEDACWTVRAERTDTGETVEVTCGFLFLNSGYYNYEGGYSPEFPGIGDFGGQVVHPQKWPEDLDYAGKRVVVIGSGATAVTLVPAMAERAAHVTMLQRSPTYIVALPGIDPISVFLRRFLPARASYFLLRWKNVLLQMASFQLSRRRPALMKRLIHKGIEKELPGLDLARDFSPRYDPWDQRLCVVPDGNLFAAIREGTAAIVTDTIDTFTRDGVRLASGRELDADIVVTATGLRLLGLGGLPLTVDGDAVNVNSRLAYKSLMLEDVPNMAFTVGYTNASWTLKADLTGEFVCRLLNHMDAGGYDTATPHNTDPSVTHAPFMNLSSGYIERGRDQLPQAGSKAPWRLDMNYAKDIVTIRRRSLDDGVMQFSRSRDRAPAQPVPA